MNINYSGEAMYVKPIYHLPTGLFDDTDLEEELVEKPEVSPLAGRAAVIEDSPKKLPRPPEPAHRTGKSPDRVKKEDDYPSPKVLHALIREKRYTAEELEQKLYGTPAVNSNGQELKTPHFYTAFFNHGFNGPDYFAVAYKAFQEAVCNNQVNNILCNQFINVAGKTGHYLEAVEALNIAISTDLLDQWTINTFLHIAGKNEKWDDVERTFGLACQRGLCDGITGNTLLETAGKIRNFNLAKGVFDCMIEVPGMADAFTFSTYIRTAGNCGDFQECQKAYRLAKERASDNPKILNSYVFNNFIFAAFKHNKSGEAKAVFEEASKLGQADKHVIRTYNNALISKAKKVSKY